MSVELIRPIQVGFAEQGSLTELKGAQGAAVPFKEIFQSLITEVNTATEISAKDASELVMGTNADLHTIMINSAMETTAIETVVELTSRVVSVYKEIMQMQI